MACALMVGRKQDFSTVLPFTKMHGLGNDYVFFDAFSTTTLASRDDLPEIARRIGDRHTGVGSDGLILVGPASRKGAERGAAASMRMFNADGSVGEMCGNGVRCAAKLLIDRGHVPLDGGCVRIETGAGVLAIEPIFEQGDVCGATVDMGLPIVEPERVGVDVSNLERADPEGEADVWLVNDLPAVFVSMGNPHMVTFVSEAPTPEFLSHMGPRCEEHPAFARRINVHFVLVSNSNEAAMWTWERGAGLTRACGTGACAALVAGVLTGRLDRRVELHLPGGDLALRWENENGHLFMTGPAVEVFSGVWPG